MVESSDINPGNSFIYYDLTYCYSTPPMLVEIQEYEDGFKGHSLYTITNSNNCPVISPTRELKFKLYQVKNKVDVRAEYYKALIRNGGLYEEHKEDYTQFLNDYPEKML